jgi:hypothetical protein
LSLLAVVAVVVGTEVVVEQAVLEPVLVLR